MTKPGFKIHDTEHWDPPASGMGVGFFEPPRGALGHWIKIKDKKIENYQAVVPSTWNASPRCENGVRGQYEGVPDRRACSRHEEPDECGKDNPFL